MLVLTRKKSEKVIITVPPSTAPQTVAVWVTDIDRNKVRIAFEAVKEIKIYREELIEEPAP